MKKNLFLFSALILTACSNQVKNTVALTPPDLIKSGFIKLNGDTQYYIDSNSISMDKADKRLVHFDAVINLDKGEFVYKEQPELYAKSMRQNKILNCENYRLIQTKTDFYSEYWGTGILSSPLKQEKNSISLEKGSLLYKLSQIMCANLSRSW
ncbi:hypothetical protein JFL47_06055 [Haemophilus haemoglobinophilus]|nr:hypothetical protein [Canicola haemoglobinophilus]